MNIIIELVVVSFCFAASFMQRLLCFDMTQITSAYIQGSPYTFDRKVAI
jgi:hypothetical protein